MKPSPIALNPCWEFDDFKGRAVQIALQFQQDNVKAVGLWFEDAAAFACALLACFQAGVRVLLPPNLLPENLQWLEANADFLLNDEKFGDYGSQQVADLALFKVDFQSDTEVWLKTSGSSGEAKILPKTTALLWREAAEVSRVLPFQNDDVQIVGSVSVQHYYGLTFRVLLPLYQRLQGKGWQIGREQLSFPEGLISHSRQALPTVWVSSPALLNRLDFAVSRFDGCQIAAVLSSGGMLSADCGLAVQNALNVPVVEIYGSTETGAIAVRQPDQPWRALPDVKLGQNEQGALWVQSGRILGREQMADVVEFCENGFELLGRMDRIVKLGDKRISLVSVEQDLLKHHFIDDVFVGKHPEKQRVVAWVALNEQGIDFLRENGRKNLIEILRQTLLDRQEKFALPRYWRFANVLPRNAQAKILRTDFEQICQQAVLEPLWEVQSAVENSLVLQGKVPLDLAFFKGHFANFPLVPGVVELQWAIEQAKAWLGRELRVERVDNLKFQQFLRPNDEVELTLIWDEAKHRVKFQLKSNGESCASGLIIEKC